MKPSFVPRIAGATLLTGLLLAVAPRPAAAELTALTASGLTLDVPATWHYAGVAPASAGGPSDVDVLRAPSMLIEVRVAEACPALEASWSPTAATYLPSELGHTWRDAGGRAELGCGFTRRGVVVVLVSLDEPEDGPTPELAAMVTRLLRAARAPDSVARAAASAVRSRQRPSTPTAFAIGPQLAWVHDPVRYRGAARLDELVGRVAVYFDPLVVHGDVDVGRADTSALRLELDLLLGVGRARAGTLASIATGVSVGTQTGSGTAALEMDDPPIPAIPRVPIALDLGVRLAPWLQVGGRVVLAWGMWDDARRAGAAPGLGISDELTLELHAHVGGRRGVMVGMGYEEALGTGMVVLTVAVSGLPR